jgi:hypothetical protein
MDLEQTPSYAGHKSRRGAHMADVFNVINLDRTPARFAQFIDWNPDFQVERVSAFDGAKLDRADCVKNSLIREENIYAPGAIGSLMSHISLWGRCAASGQPMHIAEDDIVIRPDFWPQAHAALARLPAWDIVLWTHNFDWPVQIYPGPGLGPVVLQYNPEAVNKGLAQFRASTQPPTLCRLGSAAAIACYSISPKGAARMLADCLPIGNTAPPYVAQPDIAWHNSALDVEMSRHYANWNAYVSIPPLAVAPNDQTSSTIRGHLAAMHDPAIANPLAK